MAHRLATENHCCRVEHETREPQVGHGNQRKETHSEEPGLGRVETLLRHGSLGVYNQMGKTTKTKPKTEVVSELFSPAVGIFKRFA